MEYVDLDGLLPLCTSQESYGEGDEGDWFDDED